MSRRARAKFRTPRERRKKRGVWFWLFLALALAAILARHWHGRPRTSLQKAPAPASPAERGRLSPTSAELRPSSPEATRDVFEAQVALAQRVISPGSIDGVLGAQTRKALSVFQAQQGLPVTGAPDAATLERLKPDAPLLRAYTVTTNDLAQLQPLGKTWLAKSEQTALDYETELERVAEKSHANPKLIRQLNPGADWEHLAPGTVLQVPDVNYPAPAGKADFVVIHLEGKFLEAFDENTNLLAHFPCSIAARVEKRPIGELHVVVIVPHPNYTVDPELFPESAELQALGHKLILPPGPNNPVGVAWIGLDRPGYGIHGTPVPELVGRTESHGCFRLANWDAAYLLNLAWVGMPVFVEP